MTPNPPNPIIEDVSDNQPISKPKSTTFPPVGNVEETVEVNPEISSKQNFIHEKEKNIEDPKYRENPTVQNTKTQTEKPFNLEAEIGKLKIAFPLSKLAKHDVYRSQITKSLNINITGLDDSLNILDDQPKLLFGPEVNGKPENGGTPPFYVSLNVHDKILHNAMLDSGASHNLMPKAVMERLNLDITRPYKDLFSFDSSQVKCLGLIKDLCVTLV